MAAKSAADSVKLSLDLVESAKRELLFLKNIDRKGSYYEPDVIKCAIYRYEKCWLPLLRADAGLGTRKSPPADVHWVWHVHMLSPTTYAADCRRTHGAVFAHSLAAAAGGSAEAEWEASYGPEEPFQLSSQQVRDRRGIWGEHLSDLSYDIEGAALRQRMFYYQVSLPHFMDDRFLHEALVRYKRYLFLKKHNKDTFLVPCYDIDLIWHTHQVICIHFESLM